MSPNLGIFATVLPSNDISQVQKYYASYLYFANYNTNTRSIDDFIETVFQFRYMYLSSQLPSSIHYCVRFNKQKVPL